jgi:hypothetical protein
MNSACSSVDVEDRFRALHEAVDSPQILEPRLRVLPLGAHFEYSHGYARCIVDRIMVEFMKSTFFLFFCIKP